MRIVLVEDDHMQADWIRKTLASIPASVEVVKTELGFLAFLESMQTAPDLFVVDEMLRWADPPSLNDPPQQERPKPAGPPQRAGVRLLNELTTRETTKNVPVILYTVLDELDVKFLGIPPSVTHVTKSADATALLNVIRGLTKNRAASS